MKKGRGKKPVSPIYTIAIIWLLFSAFAPIYNIIRLIAVAALSLVGFGVVSAIMGGGRKDAEPEEVREEPKTEEPKKAEPESKYPPEVQAVVDEGTRAQTELGRLYASIPELSVKRKIRDIMEISDKIVADAIEDPSDVPQIKKFLDYYLPTTIKLLNAYDRMGAQGIEGENITGAMRSIEEMLDTAVDSYKKLLDSLFANQVLDIETDIEVMNTLLKREGLGGSSIR